MSGMSAVCNMQLKKPLKKMLRCRKMSGSRFGLQVVHILT